MAPPPQVPAQTLSQPAGRRLRNHLEPGQGNSERRDSVKRKGGRIMSKQLVFYTHFTAGNCCELQYCV